LTNGKNAYAGLAFFQTFWHLLVAAEVSGFPQRLSIQQEEPPGDVKQKMKLNLSLQQARQLPYEKHCTQLSYAVHF
jgi:hypothetical protein